MTYSKLALSVPPNVANERLNAFFKDLGEIRRKHSIPDVHCIIQQTVDTASGEGPGLCTIHYGDQQHALAMCSYAMGHAQGESQKFILAARAHGMKLGAELAVKEARAIEDDLFNDE